MSRDGDGSTPGRSLWAAKLLVAMIGLGAGLVACDADASTGRRGVEDQRGSARVPTSEAVTLVEFTPEPSLLYYPTRLPSGWGLCRQLEDVSQGDRFCPLEEEGASGWLQVAVKPTDTVQSGRSVATGDEHNGRWLDAVEQRSVVYSAGRIFSLVVSTSVDGLGSEDILAVAGSIPLVSTPAMLYGSYEVPLDFGTLTDDQLAGLVASIDAAPTVVANRNGLDAQVFFTAGGSLSMFFGEGFTTPDLALSIPLPRLAETTRPLVVGESPSEGRGFAVWDQRGFGWRLELIGDAETAEAAALEIMARIAGLDP